MRSESLPLLLLVLVLSLPPSTAESKIFSLPEGVEHAISISPRIEGGFWIAADDPPSLVVFDPQNGSGPSIPLRLPPSSGPVEGGGDLWGVVEVEPGRIWISSAKRGALYLVDEEGEVLRSVEMGRNSTPLFVSPDGKGGVVSAPFRGSKLVHVRSDGSVVEIQLPPNVGPSFSWGEESSFLVSGSLGGVLLRVREGGRFETVLSNLSFPLSIAQSGSIYVSEHGTNAVRSLEGRSLLPPHPTLEGAKVALSLGLVPDGEGGVWTSLHTTGYLGRILPGNVTYAWPLPLGPAAGALALAGERSLLVLPLREVPRVVVVHTLLLPPPPPLPIPPTATLPPSTSRSFAVDLESPAPSNSTLVAFGDAEKTLGILTFEGSRINPSATAGVVTITVPKGTPEGVYDVAYCVLREGVYACRTGSLTVSSPPTATPLGVEWLLLLAIVLWVRKPIG